MFRSSDNDLRCNDARAYVSRALDDDLDEPACAALTVHLAGCEDCRRHDAVLRRGRETLQASLVEPADNFEWKVQLGIQKALRERAAQVDAPSPSFWRPALSAAAGVALLVVGLGGYMVGAFDGFVEGSGPAARAGSAQLAQTSAAPDLSGARLSEPFELDATGEGFGIRTVSGTVSDPRFHGELYGQDFGASSGAAGRVGTPAALPVSQRGVRSRTSVPVWPIPNGLRGVFDVRTGWGASQGRIEILNLRHGGSTLPGSQTMSVSTADSSLQEN